MHQRFDTLSSEERVELDRALDWRPMFFSTAALRIIRVPPEGSRVTTLLFADGACEDSSEPAASVVAFLILTFGRRLAFGAPVLELVTSSWRSNGQEQVIGQVELA